MQLACMGLVIDDEQVAANAIPGWLHQADGGIGRDRGVHCISTTFQLRRAGPSRQRLAGGNNAIVGRYYGTADHRPKWRMRVL